MLTHDDIGYVNAVLGLIKHNRPEMAKVIDLIIRLKQRDSNFTMLVFIAIRSCSTCEFLAETQAWAPDDTTQMPERVLRARTDV